MKKLTLLTISLVFSLFSFASQLVLIPTGSMEQTKSAFSQKDLSVNFYNDDFVIGTIDAHLPAGSIVLDENAWADAGTYYFMLRFDPLQKDNYINTVTQSAKILYQGKDFLVVSTDEQKAAQL